MNHLKLIVLLLLLGVMLAFAVLGLYLGIIADDTTVIVTFSLLVLDVIWRYVSTK